MIVLLLFIFFLVVWLLWLQWVLHIKKPNKPVKPRYKLRPPYKNPKYMPNTFVPVEDHIVPTHASHTNKMNDMIGNVNSSQGVGPGILEVVVPSDFYYSKSRPAEHKWPSGSILPDYIYE